MKFANLKTASGPALVVVDAERKSYYPVSNLLPGFQGDLVDFISSGSQLSAPAASEFLPFSEDDLLAPIEHPRRNIFCVGKNYSEHAKEFNRSGFDASSNSDMPEYPVLFTKPASTVIGTGASIPSHSQVTSQLDYEVELAVIIGKGGTGITEEEAMSHVWGYTIVNDVTARDLQKMHRQWFLGKSLDGFCPMGPYAVTADEIDGRNLDVKCWVNDELRQSANTAQLIFDIPRLIATLSAGISLQPGDIIATGTPAGVGIGFTPPRFLTSGDRLRLSVSGIGELHNTIA
ncbi:5-oxopent-3-ene-1,2,5-tricarboxylate decarboxylase [Burkholderia lata]|uniref:5-oxopent-3-ene-1,2,5-tricarboxylate decarboxylase n=1 Tax=Burkholderia lata (strain ATCC 17760 / DSM 23089 / LMG 22485 / NCIMB 9086 / R18194 / 383) TaxID=482957 RepID=A0A6P2V232_BURL3|nr:fumarylacetoacetate hydrolase family protein [Burkholderia lata]VWC77252.1 5-oxopent-3-ene-1,2,5-tricarboxylate decarboxylase [Burkholderia lata]